MKNLFLLIIAFSLLSSCNFIEDKKRDLTTSATEKILEKISGASDVEFTDVNNLDKNNTIVDIQVNGKNLKNDFKNAFGSITASKETIAITISKENDGSSFNIIMGFTEKDLTASKPIKGDIQSTDSDKISFQFSISSFGENKMDSKLSQEGKGEIIKLTDKEVIIKVSGKIFSQENYDNPEKWENYSGTIIMQYPVYNSMGISKDDLNY